MGILEKLRLEAGTGIAIWWRDYADPDMDRPNQAWIR